MTRARRKTKLQETAADSPKGGVPVEIQLPEVLDLLAAADLKKQLLDEIGDHRSVRLETGAVEFVSTACIQVLLSALGHYADKGADIALAGHSENLVSAIRSLGLEGDFGRWRHVT